MRVLLSRQTFAGGVRPLDLLALLRLAFEERHVIELEPPSAPVPHDPFQLWLEQLPRTLQADARYALDYALRYRRSNAPAPHWTIRVEPRAESRWQETPPRLGLEDALRFLHTPLHIMVENHQSDRGFLRAMLLPLYRRRLDLALQRGWCTFQNGGGIGGIQAWLTEHAQNVEVRLRTWFLFDSDAPERGHPSEISRRIQATAQRAGFCCHQLERRNAESYLSLRALNDWAGRSQNRRRRRRKYSALCKLEPEHRWYFNIKSGQRGPLPVHLTYLDAWTWEALAGGLGDTVRAMFTANHDPDWLLDPDTSGDERQLLADSLLRCL